MDNADKIRMVAEEIATAHALLGNAKKDREERIQLLGALDQQIAKTQKDLKALYTKMRGLLTDTPEEDLAIEEPAPVMEDIPAATEPAPVPVKKARRVRSSTSLASQIVAFLEAHKGNSFTSNEIADFFSAHPRSSVTARLAHLSKGGRVRHTGRLYSAITQLNSLQETLLKAVPPRMEDRVSQFLKEKPESPFRPGEVAQALGVNPASCNTTLIKLYHAGRIQRVQKGVYQAKGGKATQVDKILAYLRENAVKYPVSVEKVSEATGIQQHSTGAVLSKLFNTGKILRTLPGHYAYPIKPLNR